MATAHHESVLVPSVMWLTLPSNPVIHTINVCTAMKKIIQHSTKKWMLRATCRFKAPAPRPNFPAIAGKLGLGAGALNRQVARSIHFLVLCWMIFFIAVHTLMVWITGLLGNVNHITLGTNTDSWWAVAIYAGGMAVVIGLWAWASPFTIRHPRVVQHTGAFMVGWAKGLMEWWDPRSTYQEKDISTFFWPNGHLPDSPEYTRLKTGGFADYRLRID